MATIGHTYTIQYECGGGNDYSGRLDIRISAIFVIGFGSMLGVLAPIAAARAKRLRVPPLAFFIMKYFGSGVIIATAFIHLLAPAMENLGSPCLTGSITHYAWAPGIALMTIFVMFLIELMAARYDVFGHTESDLEAAGPAVELARQAEKYGDADVSNASSQNSSSLGSGSSEIDASNSTTLNPTQGRCHDIPSKCSSGPESREITSKIPTRGSIPGRENDLSYPPGGEDHLGHQRSHLEDDDHFAAQMTAIFILEFGVVFHSVFIGLTLAVAGDNFNVLYIVLAFHQTFEGLGLGSRLATTEWPKKRMWWPWALGATYGVTTPVAIAIGLAVRTTFSPGSQRTMIVNGVFDSISAGILIYTGLVELMAHEFMFNPEMRKSSIRMMLFAFLCMCSGAGLMALLGKWA